MRGVIFDLDGTLVDSLRDIADAMDQVLDELGLPRRTLAEYERFVGEGARVLVRRSLGQKVELEDEALAAFRDRYRSRMLVHTRPYPGIEPLLEALASRGAPAAVLSNKPHDATVAIVDALLSRHPFVAVLGHREGSPRKPDPSGALELARAMSRAPSEVLFLGDTPIDVATARAAGMIAVGALWGMRSREELEAAGAARVIERPEELLELVE
ncbi:MAG TPA: HAD family hydrolase [Sandaracinaceae bacterium]